MKEERKLRKKSARNKRQRKMVQIFVKVDVAEVTPMEVSLTNGKVQDVMRQIQKDEDVYGTMHGNVLSRNEKLKSCGVTDGCTIQVTSRMRGGGRHKDKKSKSEKKQTTNPERPEQKRDGESRSDEGPEMMHMDEAMRRLEENEEYQKNIECVSEGSEGEVQQKVQNYLAHMQKVSWMNKEQFEHLESGVCRPLKRGEKEMERSKSTGGRTSKNRGNRRNGGRNRGRNGRARAKHRTGAKQARQASAVGRQRTVGRDASGEHGNEPEVTGRTTEVRTGRGSAGLVRGRDERRRTDETSRKGKGKGNGGKGEHEGKGGRVGRKGTQQVENLVMDEIQENNREDVRKLVEMMQKEKEDQEGQRGRVAPNMGAGGSYPGHVGPRKERDARDEMG